MPKPITFWFDFASTYSYLAAMRVDRAAEACGVEAIWRPFLLGPIFVAQGWKTSPFNIYPAKGENMWRDLQRQAEESGLPLYQPSENQPRLFPQNGLLAARCAIVGLYEDWGRAFCRSVYRAQFGEGKDISDVSVLEPLIEEAGGVGQTVLFSAHANSTKNELRRNVEEAIELGIYGAPSFTVDDELFWGNDRLEHALNWALKDG